MKPRILIITSTVREKRMSRMVAEWYKREAERVAPEVEFAILDIAELKLPLFEEPIDPLTASQSGKYTDKQQALADRISSADGFVIVTGEYNHGVPAALKNMLDYLTPAEWKRKAVAYVGYGVRGAFWSISNLFPVMSYLGVMSVMEPVNIRSFWEAFDESGNLKPSYAQGSVDEQLEELLWWVRALKAQRFI